MAPRKTDKFAVAAYYRGGAKLRRKSLAPFAQAAKKAGFLVTGSQHTKISASGVVVWEKWKPLTRYYDGRMVPSETLVVRTKPSTNCQKTFADLKRVEALAKKFGMKRGDYTTPIRRNNFSPAGKCPVKR